MALSSVGRAYRHAGRHRSLRRRGAPCGRRRVGGAAAPKLSVRSGRAVRDRTRVRPADDASAGDGHRREHRGRRHAGAHPQAAGQAERAGTPEEAQACTDKAVELMARHGIDMALLGGRAGARRDRRHPHGGRRPVQRGQGPAARLDGVGAALPRRAAPASAAAGSAPSRCSGSPRTASGSRCCSPRCSCRPRRSWCGSGRCTPGESVAAYRRSWLHGFAVQVHRRLVDAERAEPDSGRGAGPGPAGGARVRRAAVLADRRSQVDGLRRGVPRRAAAGGRCSRAPGSPRARPRASAPTWVPGRCAGAAPGGLTSRAAARRPAPVLPWRPRSGPRAYRVTATLVRHAEATGRGS